MGRVTARERLDVALVGLGESSEHALSLIQKDRAGVGLPVIVLIHAPDPGFVKEASKRGIFAHITDAEPQDWQSSIDIVLRRFAEYHDLEGPRSRCCEHSRAANRKLVDIASGVVDGQPLPPNRSKARP